LRPFRAMAQGAHDTRPDGPGYGISRRWRFSRRYRSGDSHRMTSVALRYRVMLRSHPMT
jgi:hypothetical protein